MKWHGILWILLLLIPAESSASKRRSEGSAPLGLDLSASPRTSDDGLWTLTIWTWSNVQDADAPALATIDVGRGAEVVDGPLKRMIRRNEHWFWTVKLRKTSSAPVRIVGTLKIPGKEPGSYYYCERLLEVGFDGLETTVNEVRDIQRVAYRGGRRFRLGGEFPVAIEDDEVEAPRRIVSRPELISKPDVTCDECKLSQPMDVAVVVTVGKGGAITWIRPKPLSPSSVPGAVWAAVLSTVSTYRFRPAVSDRGPVADFAVVKVRVQSAG